MKIKAAILSVCSILLTYLVLTVAVAGLVAAFPAVPRSRVILVLTIPPLIAIAGIVTVPMLLGRFSRRTLTLCGLCFMLAGCLVSLLFARSLPMLLIAACLLGIAYGSLSTLYPLLIDASFSGPDCARMMGLATGMSQLGRLVLVLFGGFLADIRWNYVYFVFVFVQLSLVLCALWLPKDAPRPRTDEQRAQRKRLGGSILRLSAVGFLFVVFYFVNSTHTSLYIEGYGLGSASVTGTLIAVSSAVAGVMAFLFGRLQRWLKKYTFAAAFLVMGAGYTLAGMVVSLPTICLGLMCGAFGLSLSSPNLMLETTACVDSESLPLAMAIVIGVLNVGFFVSPYIAEGLSALLSESDPASVFRTMGLGALATGLALACAAFFQRNPLLKGEA